MELLLQTAHAGAVATAVAGMDMVAPDLLNPEVLSILRRLERRGMIGAKRAGQALTDLTGAPLLRLPTLPLLPDVWALRANLSAYDACYVAAARSLGCALVTADARLGRAPGLGIPVIVV